MELVDNTWSRNQTGSVVVQKVAGKSTVTCCFARYPLKFISPKKAGSSKSDAVWIYIVSYGGGIVSGDYLSFEIVVGEGCTAVFTTQSSTKVYKSLAMQCSQQVLEARIGSNALLVLIPDPVTCFSTARYSQKQIFRLSPDSSLVIVDWLTSGRHERGERWDFELYKSMNHIFLEGDCPLFLDTLLLERDANTSIAERMQDYQVIAMLILIGSKSKHAQNQVQEEVKKMMSCILAPSRHCHENKKPKHENHKFKPVLIASCSAFGPKDMGLVVRIAAMETELVYKFLQQHLASLEPLIGASPYC